MTTDAGNVSVRHLRQTTCLEAEEAGSEFQEEIPGNLIGGNLDHPVLGKLVKYLKSQQRNPTNLTQWTAQVSNITTLVTSSQESTNRRMALRAQLPSGMGEGGSAGQRRHSPRPTSAGADATQSLRKPAGGFRQPDSDAETVP